MARVDAGCMFGKLDKGGAIVFVDSCTCDRHAGTVHPAKDTWDLDGRFCFEVM